MISPTKDDRVIPDSELLDKLGQFALDNGDVIKKYKRDHSTHIIRVAQTTEGSVNLRVQFETARYHFADGNYLTVYQDGRRVLYSSDKSGGEENLQLYSCIHPPTIQSKLAPWSGKMFIHEYHPGPWEKVIA